MISAETGLAIARAHQEISSASELLSKIEEGESRRNPVDVRDAFGRRMDGLQLGVPSGESGHRLYAVSWKLARPTIEAHIAEQRSIIMALGQKALAEAAQNTSDNQQQEAG